MKLKNRYCPECGGEIIFHYETPTKVYTINDVGALERDDNNILDSSELNPYCCNDKEHNIEPKLEDESVEFWKWFDDVSKYFIENAIYET